MSAPARMRSMRTRASVRTTRAFSLIELPVALAVFAALAAVAYGGLSQIARVRGALAEKQERFATIVRTFLTSTAPSSYDPAAWREMLRHPPIHPATLTALDDAGANSSGS